ncbi:peroxidasin homolog [Limulus polyphemus]|uniref:Peroxidasin homolog n=1 Tax=Limulus polyphemus TaxID=6850 RepID=A0ABM1SJJ9_LIMPO|nr:peroxidasin homolog [Limulus polyphemus]
MKILLWFETTFGLLMLSVQNSVAQLNSILSVPPDIHDFGGSSECALVLRRTYLDGRRKSAAPSYGGFFNLLKPGPIHHNGPTEEICIRYTDVNLALAEAKRRKGHRTPRTIQSLEPHPSDIGITGELVLETTRILALQFKLSRDEVMNGLPMIDTSRTDIWEICPAHVKPVPCTIERHRSYTGICNNVQHSSWGSTHTPFVRFLPPAYVDGISVPRISVSGGPLPPARVISSHIHPDVDFPSNELSVLVMSWGQFIDHDMTLAAVPRDERDLDFKCCGIPKEIQHPNCMTIDIPPDDPFYSRYGQQCMEFKRLEAGQRPGCTLGPRTHINLDTSPLDANFVYGSTEDLAHKLRLGKGGEDPLRTLLRQPYIVYEPGKMDELIGGLINTPAQVYDPFITMEVLYGYIHFKFEVNYLSISVSDLFKSLKFLCKHFVKSLLVSLALLVVQDGGDERVNEQIHLTVLHTLYVRDHNRIAIELGRLNPHWDDERIYHEARHIMAGSVQHITFNEFLPMTVGEEMVHKYNLTLNPEFCDISRHPDDIDLWSGGISEYRLRGAMIGPTFACIIARQFDNVRRGDRFWYENSGFPSAFTPEQLQEIRKSFQSKLICENADDIPTIQLYAMRLPHPIYNPRLPCKEIPSIDLRYWQEDPVHGGYTFKK